MRTTVTALLTLGLTGAVPSQQPLWQADVQIRSLTVSAVGGKLSAQVVVGSEIGEAMAVKLEVLLPVGVGIVELGSGCVAGPSAPGVPALRARVVCAVGNLAAHASREYKVVTTIPPIGVARRFGAIATSDTPDPRPANNFAEQVLP